MDKKDKYLIAIAIVICIVICCLSPYIASGDPDGLEKSNMDAHPEDEEFAVTEIGGIPEAIFPDYALAADPDNQIMQVGILILGAIITLVVGYGIAQIVRRRD